MGPLLDKGPTRGSMVCEKVQSVGPLLDKGPTRGSMVCEKVQSVGPLLDKGPTRGSMVCEKVPTCGSIEKLENYGPTRGWTFLDKSYSHFQGTAIIHRTITKVKPMQSIVTDNYYSHIIIVSEIGCTKTSMWIQHCLLVSCS